MNRILCSIFEVAFYFLNNAYVEHQPADYNSSTVVLSSDSVGSADHEPGNEVTDLYVNLRLLGRVFVYFSQNF
jgi:hypothetical protein